MNTVISMQDLQKKTDFKEMQDKMKQEMATCGVKELSSADLQVLRRGEGSSAVCSSADMNRKEVTQGEIDEAAAAAKASGGSGKKGSDADSAPQTTISISVVLMLLHMGKF